MPATAGETATENTYLIITTQAGENVVLDALAEESVIAEEENVITASLTKAEATSVAGMDETLYVEEDLDVVACGINDSGDEAGTGEWNLQMIEAHGQEADAASVASVKVAVIDSGVSYSDDINVVERKNFVEGDGKVSILYEDGSGHGTAIAGIIGARDNDMGVTGVCPDVEIYSARVLDDSNHTSLSKLIAGINWAVEQDVDIMNLSLGCAQDSPALHHALAQAEQAGILIIGAAGNGGNVMYPAAYNEVMAVGAVGTDGLHSENSSVGEELELVAPGEQILSTGMFDGVMTCGGSSMAAAHVTGVAAALWGQDKGVTAGFIRSLMDVSAKVYDDTELYGYGLIDMENAFANYESVKTSYVESADV